MIRTRGEITMLCPLGKSWIGAIFARVILSSQACSILCCALTWLRQLVVKLSRGRTPYCQNWRIMVRWSCSLSLYLSVRPSIFLSVCLSDSLSVQLLIYVSLSLCLSVPPTGNVYLSVCLSVCLTLWLSVRSTVNLCLSVFVFVCPSNW